MTHTPWTKPWEYFPSRSKPRQSDCDPVTCSECPGGERCCNHSPQASRKTDYTDLLYANQQKDWTEGLS